MPIDAALDHPRQNMWRFCFKLNTLTLKETKVVLEGIAIGGKSMREHFEVVNHKEAKGQQYAFSDSNIQKAVQALTDIPFDSLMNTSEQVYDLLTLGTSSNLAIPRRC